MKSKWLHTGISMVATMAGAFTVNSAVFGQENPAGASPDTAKLIANVPVDPLDPKYTAMPKISSDLVELYYEHLNYQQRGGFQTLRQPFASKNQLARLVEEGVIIDAVAQQDAKKLLADLETLGLRNGVAFGSIVSGLLPINTVATMANLNSLNFARPAYAMTNAGAVTSQGDQAMRADIARTTFSLDGTGVKVGTLSDSYNCLGGAAGDVASGDLPAGITVLQEYIAPNPPYSDPCTGATDEGRAMMQLIHDVAPGATQAFHTALNGMADFAQGIIDLADAGATVIVDDVGYLTAPFFQDGIIAQAVNQVVGRGVAYFSSAGNRARNSYESAFRPSGIIDPVYGEFHDFDPGPGVDIYQSFSIPPSGSARISLQWDQPYFSVSGSPGSASDLALLIYNSSLTLLGGSDNSNIGRDPVEFAYGTELNNSTTNTANRAIAIAKKTSGPNPSLIKYITFGNMTIMEYDTSSSTTFGHANAAGAEATGAAFYYFTPAFGTTPPTLESFSSAGGTPIFFEVNGTRKTQPEVRQKPEIVGPDGTNNTFFGTYSVNDGDSYPNFFGTSAAAPHAAAVAALLRQTAPNLSPAGVYGFMERTAIDMRTPGFDYDSGFGLVQADAALTCPQTTLTLTAGQWRMIGLPCNVGSNNTVQTVFGDLTGTYGQRWVVYDWNPITQKYRKLALGDPLEEGRGYWIKALDSSPSIGAGGMLNNPLLPSLGAAPPTPGRNMVGHPFTFPVCWANVKVVDGANQLTLDQADPGGACEQSPLGANCVMSRIMHKWNGAAYQVFDGQTTGMEGTLEVFDGFVVKTFKHGVQLLIPDTPASSCTGPVVVATAAEDQSIQINASQPRYPAPKTRYPDEWGLRLIVEADGLVDPGNLLGRLRDSADGYDQHDLKEPSPFDTSKFLTIVFPHAEWAAYAGDYASDYRAIVDGGVNEWTFEVRSNQPRTITLSWAGPDDILQHSKLIDDETKKNFNPNPNNTYTVTMTKPVHRFRWRVNGGR